MFLEGDLQMPASNAQNDATLDHFFNVINGVGTQHYQDLNYLMQQVFCPNANPTSAHPLGSIPAVGITNHGPQFYGADQVRLMFDTLFTVFPNFQSTPQLSPNVAAKRLYSHDQTMIGIQTTLTGTQKAKWFQHTIAVAGKPDHYSPPISDIEPDGTRSITLPVANVMTFDENGKIVQLSMYFDRYLMNSQLFTGVTPPQAAIFSHIVEHAVRKLVKP
jgi:hypothetical protein